MRYLSVCSGIEAATVAWHGLGWEPVAFSEIEAFPAAVLAHHYPTVPNLGDMAKYREWPEELLAQVDLLVGGTPCQAFSVAGKRQSLDDERGNLSLVYVNLYHHINEVRKRHGRSPAIALWENVPGVLSTKDNAFGCFIGGLLGCDEAPETESGKWDKAGFLSSETVRVGYRVLDAQYFGVAQRRRRVFLAAVPCELVERFGERACPSEILSLRESVLGNPPTRGAAWEGAARATAAGAASGGRGVERPGESRGQDDVVIDAPPVCGTLSDGAHMGGGVTGRTHTRAESCPCVANPLTARMHKGINTTADEGQTPIVTQGGAFSRAAFGGNNRSGSIDVAASLLSHSGPHGRQDFTSETFLVEGHPDPAYAISAGQQGKGGVFGSGRDSQDTFVICFHPTQDPISSTDGSAHAMGTGSNGGCSSHAVCVTAQAVAFTKAKRAQSSTDDESWVPGEVAPTQNSRDEVRQINGCGRVAGALNADSGMHQTNYLAYGVTTEQTPKFSEEKALTITRQSPTGGGQPQCVAFNGYQRTEQQVTWPIQASDSRKVEVGVRSDMQVRRLTPRECEFLQGFPPDYTAVTYRKKPAADGPRYRALGNSMAVPCMWWLGHRIAKATAGDNK